MNGHDDGWQKGWEKWEMVNSAVSGSLYLVTELVQKLTKDERVKTANCAHFSDDSLTR